MDIVLWDDKYINKCNKM